MEEGVKNGRKSNQAGAIIATGIIGLAAGAALGLLFAPKSGKETRAALAGKARELNESRRQTMDALASRARAVGESGKETIDSIAGKVRSLSSR